MLLLLELSILLVAAVASAPLWLSAAGPPYWPALVFALVMVFSMGTLGMYHPDVILAGRRINDNMAKFVAEKTVKEMVRAGFKLKGCHVNVLGLTFKENCPDLRNSKVADLIRELESYGLQVHVHDPVADAGEALHEYGVRLQAWDELPAAEALITAVAHRELAERPLPQMLEKVAPSGCFIDLKAQFDPAMLRASGLNVWRL
ncbi:UDP-glucose/GDP-mannose dehydrogenase family, UDP binding domain [Duganella sp. OV458]|nr:UDP-glucose/GDP-mannose dehydrogenase family, UDP binding domain [Duganella sp. OV458]SDK12102.1 UDP-N-acetyl-D-galactosamine dehydrogenase [Duganella sp. OV510]